MAEYTTTNIGSTEHWTTATLAEYRDLTARTLCGQLLAGTPASPVADAFCGECQALMPCDECDHPGTEHVWAPAAEERSWAAGQFTYEHATCWSENICRLCNPERHAQVLAIMAEPPVLTAEQQAMAQAYIPGAGR